MASTTTVPRARAATTPACARVTTPGTPITRSPLPARRASTSRSRGRFRPGAGPSASSPPRPRTPGPNLNRRTFVEAMSKITNYPGTLSPVWTLRAQQVLRADAVPGGQDPQQRAAVVAVQAQDEPQAAGHLLGDDRAVQAAAGLVGLVVPRAITTGGEMKTSLSVSVAGGWRPSTMPVVAVLVASAWCAVARPWRASGRRAAPACGRRSGSPHWHSSQHGDATQRGQHVARGGEQDRDQRRLPGRRHQQPGRPARLRRGQGVQRADPRPSTST